jgi:predicted acyltransferase
MATPILELPRPEHRPVPVADSQAQAASKAMNKPERLTSLDAYRGFIMLVMASGGFGFAKVAQQSRGDLLWQFLGYEFDHVAWVGCSFWDLIQPSFMFMVGVAMPYSYASRSAKGHTPLQNFGHVLARSLILIALAIFLSSNGEKQPHFVFTNVLAQIGLGYAFVYFFLGRGVRVQLAAIVVILIGYWLFFYLFPLRGPDFDYKAVGAAKEHFNDSLFAHWNKNSNVAAAFDEWFLNFFPRESPFIYNEGGYQTLNFIPSMATMLFGLMAGDVLRSDRAARTKLRLLLMGGAFCLTLGFILGLTICPCVKRIWTPTWAIFSAGWTFYMLAGFYWIIDLAGYKRWAFPLVIVGMNSIAMYCMSQLMKPWLRQTLDTWVGREYFEGTYGIIWQSVGVLFVLWLICLWLYRRRIFIRI